MFDFRLLLLLLLVTLKKREWEFHSIHNYEVQSCHVDRNTISGEWWSVRRWTDDEWLWRKGGKLSFLISSLSLSVGPHCNRDKSRPRKKCSPFSQHDVHCQLYSNKKIYHQHIFLALLVNYRNNLTSCHRHPQEVAAFSPCHPLTELDSSPCRVNICSPKRDNQLRGDRTFSFILWCCGGDHYLRDFFPQSTEEEKSREKNYF